MAISLSLSLLCNIWNFYMKCIYSFFICLFTSSIHTHLASYCKLNYTSPQYSLVLHAQVHATVCNQKSSTCNDINMSVYTLWPNVIHLQRSSILVHIVFSSILVHNVFSIYITQIHIVIPPYGNFIIFIFTLQYLKFLYEMYIQLFYMFVYFFHTYAFSIILQIKLYISSVQSCITCSGPRYSLQSEIIHM